MNCYTAACHAAHMATWRPTGFSKPSGVVLILGRWKNVSALGSKCLEIRRMWDDMMAHDSERAMNDQECSKWFRGTPMIKEGERVAGRAMKKQASDDCRVMRDQNRVQ